MSDSGTFASILEYYLMIVGSLAVALVLAILGFCKSLVLYWDRFGFVYCLSSIVKNCKKA